MPQTRNDRQPTDASSSSSSCLSPSHERRQALRHADVGNTIRVLDSYPLRKYFDISQRLLDAFQTAVDARRLDEAYVYGLRFAHFGVESLPQHKEWKMKTTRHNKQKRRNAQQVEKVISMMEIIKQRMDAEELVLQNQRKARDDERRRDEEARQQQREITEQESRKRQQEQQRKIELERKKHEEQQSKNVEQSAMAKLFAMQSKISAPKQSEEQQPVKPSSQEDPKEGKPADRRTSSERIVKNKPTEAPLEEKTTTGHAMPRPNVGDKKSTTGESTVAADVGAEKIASASTPSKASSTVATTMTPRSSKEQKTIDLLQHTILFQEKRLVEIETKQIPALVRMAKEYLQKDESKNSRDAALKCVARKRALERQMDVIKAAIFNMETQMFMLENTMEDRQVQKALEEASQAMNSLQQIVGADGEATSVDLTDLAGALPSSMFVDQEEDDEELLEELQGWISPDLAKKNQATKEDDEVSILSMPNIPTSVAGVSTSSKATSDKESSSVDKLLKAVLG